MDNDYEIRCHTFDWESLKILQPVIKEYKR